MDVLQSFADLVSRPDGEIDLARAAAMIAMRDYPALDLDAVARDLDGHAAGIEDFEGLRHRLFVELGYTGEDRVYYDADNSFLHRVLERRRGIPITLCVMTLEVGRRAGVPLEPIGMPGHFLLREPESGLYLDPFHGGEVLDRAGCETVFRAVTDAGDDVPFGDFLLPVVTAAGVLERMLANLAILYRMNADAPGLEWALRLRLALPEVTGEDLVTLAQAMADQGRSTAAAAELETWAELSPDLAPALRRAARGVRARLN